MYEFSRGPLVWIAILVFLIGTIYKLVTISKMAKKDKVVYPYLNFKYGLRSIIHWMIPFANHNTRRRPAYSILSFLFHALIFITPLFAFGHVMLFNESWGFSWGGLPEQVTNAFTITVLLIGLMFGVRRLADPTARFASSIWDFVLLLLVLAPFFSGMLAYYQVFNYETTITIHIWTGALWLMAIPFTRLVHMIYFPLTRAYMGCEFGYVRNARDW